MRDNNRPALRCPKWAINAVTNHIVRNLKKEAVALVLNQGFSALEATRFLGIAYQYALSMEAEN